MNRDTLFALAFALFTFGILSKRGRETISSAVASTQERIAEMTTGLKRGERLNNPGNIRRTNIVWQGMSAEQSDSEFVAFVSPEYGYRAMAKILQTYANNYGVRTIAGIINRWAPPSENDTGAYVKFVAAYLGVKPTDPLTMTDPLTIRELLRAITQFEQGRVIYDDAIIVAGIEQAGIARA